MLFVNVVCLGGIGEKCFSCFSGADSRFACFNYNQKTYMLHNYKMI